MATMGGSTITDTLVAIDDGTICRVAEVPFDVALAISVHAQRRRAGCHARKPQCGNMRSRRVEARRAKILAIWKACKDIMLAELRLTFTEIGLEVSVAGLDGLFFYSNIKKPDLLNPSYRISLQTQRQPRCRDRLMRRFGQVIGVQLMRKHPGDFAHIIAGAGFAFQPMRGEINDGVVI